MANLSNINNKFLVTTGGNVLIGQTAVVGTSILQVEGSTNAIIRMNSTAGTGGRMDFAYGGSNYGNIGSGKNILGTGNAADMMINAGSLLILGVGSQDMTILPSGNVGIGTPSPATSYGFSRTLEIQGAANAEINISQSNNSKDWSLGIVNGANYQQTTSGQDYIWIIGGSEKMRIDSSGNVGIKNTSPSDFLSWQQQLVVGNGSADAGITIYHGSGGGNQGAIAFADGNTGTNRYRGIISYNGADEMKFFTSTLERIKINDAGNVFISTPITNAFYGLSLTYNNTNTADFTVNQATGQIKIGGVAAGYYPTFYSAGSERMRILANGNIAFNATSNLNSSNFQISTNSGLGANVDVFIANTSGVPYANSATTTQLSMGFLNGIANYVATGQRLGALQFFGQASDAGYGAGAIKSVVTTGGNVVRSSHAADLTFETKAAGSLGNTEKMRIASNGRVGIGTDAPVALLHLKQAAGANIRFENGTTNRVCTVGEGVGTNDVFSFRGNSYRSTDTLSVVFSTDRVGIGTISPGTKLDVNGAGSTGTISWANDGGRKRGYLYSDSAGVAIYSTALNNAGIYLADNLQVDFRVNGAERMRITSGGQLQLQGSSSSLAKSTTQTQFAYIPGNTPGASLMPENPSGMSSASAGYHIVYGANNSSPYQAFIDVITYQCGSSTTVTVISSTTLNNSPGSRSYSKNSTAVFLNISGAANYNCNIKTTFINFPH